MKKITLLLLLLFSFAGQSQVILQEGFEGTTLPDLASDTWVLDSGTWGVFDNGVGLGQSWNVNTAVTVPVTVYEGTRAAFMNRENIGNGNTSRDYLAMPAITVPTDGQLRFWTRTTINGDQGTIYKIMVAPATSPQNDPSAYTVIQQWSEDQLTEIFNVYEEKVVDLNAYAGQSVHIAFVMEYNQVGTALNGDRWLVDLVKVAVKCTDPTGLAAGLITQTSATLSWANPSGASQWEIEIVPATTTPTGTGTIVTDNPYLATTTLPGGVPFTPSTSYEYYVRAICPDNITSEWVGPFTFTTQTPGLSCASPIVVPNTPYSTTDNTAAYGDTTDVPAPCGSGGNFMQGNDVFYSYTPTESGAISITMTPTGTSSGLFVYEGCANVGVSCLAGVSNNGGTIREITSLNVTAGTQYIIVISTNGFPQSVGYTLVIQTLNCAPPNNLSAVGTGETAGVYSAELSWGNPGGATSWEYVVQNAGDPIPAGSGTTVTDNTAVSVNSLTSGAPLALGQYQYWVRADCGDGTFSPWAGPYVFNTTTCSVGCNYQFVMTDTFGDGWNGNTMNVIQGGVTVATIGSTFTTGSGPVTVSVPLCDGDFQLFWNSGGAFAGEVGVSIVNSFGQTIFNYVPGTGSQNTVLYNGVVDCVNPACLPPTNLTVSAITQTSASFAWTPGGLETQWQVIALPAGSPPPTSGTTGWTAAPTNPFVLTGLTSGTSYDFYIRGICPEGTISAWGGPLNFNTTICPPADACTYEFVLTDSFGDGWNGNTMSVIQNGIVVATLGPTFTTGNGPITIPVALCDGIPFSLFWNSGGAFANEVGIQIVNNFDQVIFIKDPGEGSQNTQLFEAMMNCDEPACLAPTNVTVSGITQTSATFAWTPGGAETSWQVIAVPAGSPAPSPTETGWTAAPTNPFTLTGLTSGTAYDFYIRAVCSETNTSAWSDPLQFNTTICPVSEQCIYTFTLTDTFGDGWNGNTMSVIQNGIVVATLGPNFTTGTGPVTVQVPLCNGLAFSLFWNNGGFFANEVGVSITSFLGEVVYTLAPGSGSQGTTLYASTTECTPPTCLKPTNVQVSNIGLNSVQVAWTENNTPPGTTWDIIVLPATSPPPGPGATGFTTVTTNPYVFTGLDPATQYVAYVRTVCSDTDSSFWSNGAAFSTLICLPSNLCEYAFVMVDSFGDSWNGNTMTVSQNGITVATLVGPDFDDDTNPVTVTLELCNGIPFELFWNNGGAFANEVGIQVVNVQTGAVLFTHTPGQNLQGTQLYSATVNCIPATCPKPVQLTATQVTETTALLSWVEAATATAWEVIILPAGSPPPTLATPGIPATNPYLATGLNSGTQYVFYVRAICAANDISNWAGPVQFATLITNDECDTATVVGVNPDQECVEFANGTVTGATPSNQPSTCFGTPDDDVWFQFTAEGTIHTVSLNDVTGSTGDLFHVVYTGECGNLTQLYCSDDNTSIANNLTAGQTYYVQVYTWTGTPNQTSSFTICIGTIPPPITSNTTQYTNVQLIEDVLLNTTCASVTNVTSSTGIDFGTPDNGIGYFERNGSSFPFENGIVLTTGDANSAPGPNTVTLSDGFGAWPGDADLTAVLAAQGITGTLNNATLLEFDFIPLIDQISFNFIFASEEYGVFQCGFSDVFAFLLTDINAGTTTNLAVVPNTTTPISVFTVRDNTFNNGCPSVNPEYFGDFYLLPEGLNPLGAPTNYNGLTVPLTASATVQPGQPYHIKLAIADFSDTAFDSAVFLEGGSFGLGNVDLGENLLEETGNAICPGGSTVLDSGLDPAIYDIQWLQNGVEIDGATTPTLTVSEEGSYTIEVNYIGTTCVGSDTIIVEVYAPIQAGPANDLFQCSASPTGTFDLTDNEASILENLGSGYFLSYYLTAADAEGEVNAISDPTAFTNTSNPQTIYVRVEASLGGCHTVTSFDLILQDLTPQFTLPEDYTICSGSESTISVTPINFNLPDAVYAWTLNGQPLPDTTPTITVTGSGLYQVTVQYQGCEATDGVNVNVIDGPEIVNPGDQTVCDSYELEPLTVGNYFTQAGGQGTPMFAGDIISADMTVYIFADNGTCTDEDSFIVDVIGTPVIDPVENVTACNCYTLPALTVGNYFSGPGGTGTQWNAGDQICTDATTVYIYAQTGTTPNCTAETSFVVTIGTLDVTTPGNQTVCDSYTLPSLAMGNYFTAANGGGTQLNVGDVITTTQTIYVFLNDGTCTDEESFVVTVNQTPVLTVNNVTACNQYQLPTLAVGNYYTAPDAGGTPLSAGDLITSTQTVYIYAATGTTPDCVAQASFTVTIGTLSITAPSDVEVCDSFTLTPLAVGGYFSQSGGVGPIDINVPITQTQTIYVYQQDGTCSAEDSFVVTINTTPQVGTFGDITSCGPYTLPALTTGTYYTGPLGTGTMLSPNDQITTDQTIYVYAQSGTTPNCWSEDSFAVTILAAPTVNPVANVSACDSFTLAPIVGDGAYFTEPDGQGTQLNAGDPITSTQTIYVYAQTTSGATVCPAQQSFTVTIGQTPEFTLSGQCNGSQYVLTVNPTNGFDTAGATYAWSAGTGGEIIGSDAGQSVVVSGAATYSVVVTLGDCSSTAGNLPVANTACQIQKGISANGDGENDYFDLEGQDVRELQIFNRYGVKVYSRANYSNQWYGQSDKGEELPDGTYYFVIDYAAGETKTGWIYINRERN